MSGDLIVSASGIRGIVGRGLDETTARGYGAAYAEYLTDLRGGAPDGIVLLGRDSRPSGPALAEAVGTALSRAGWDVGDLGIVPTPTALLAVGEDEAARGGVIVTASHNPTDWNGLKLASEAGEFLSPEGGRDVQSRFEVATGAAAGPDGGGRDEAHEWPAGSRHTLAGAIERHVERILSLPLLSAEAAAGRRLRVALDCVRGAGGLILPGLLERLGCTVVGIHLEPDGHFPRDPEPVAANLAELSALVREAGADVGMAVDPDVDRLALVDEHGVPLGEDWTLALAAEFVLGKLPGPIVTNLSSSQCIEDAARRTGQTLHRTAVGEANVAKRMAEVGAVLGGEGNGGVMLPQLHATRDAPLAAALVVGLLVERNKALSRIVEGQPRYGIVKRKEKRPSLSLEAIYRRLESEARRGGLTDWQDGLHVRWPQRREWVHVRPSGTEPIVRIIAEAPDLTRAQELADWAARVLSVSGVEEPESSARGG